MDDRFEKVDGYLFLSLGFTKQNAWAGPDHWKYQKAKGRVKRLVAGYIINQLIHFCSFSYGIVLWSLF
jgi:hypothetical protein